MSSVTTITYVEHVKDPIEVLLPTSNHIFFILRAGDPRGRILFSLLKDLPLDLGHSSAIETLATERLCIFD